MDNLYQEIIKKVLTDRKKRRRLITFTALFATLVFAYTLNALILPAMTLEKKYYCGLEEHKEHDSDCYEIKKVCEYGSKSDQAGDQVLICDEEEGEAVYETVVTYEMRPIEAVTSSKAEDSEEDATEAREEVNAVTETVLVSPGHEHTEDCYHVHTEDCFEEKLVCDKKIHEHGLACTNNPDADLESSSDWEKSLEGLKLTGDWRADLLEVAQTQLGYEESIANFKIAENGTTKGYTRYGDWYGDPYGDWCAMYISFCLHYAGIPKEAMPQHANCSEWIDVLKEKEKDSSDLDKGDLYQEAGDYIPVPGDIVFFRFGSTTRESNHVGIALELVKNTKDEITGIKVIEGNASDRVKINTYDLDDSHITGYGILPENPDQEKPSQAETEEETAEDAPSLTEDGTEAETAEESNETESNETESSDRENQDKRITLLEAVPKRLSLGRAVPLAGLGEDRNTHAPVSGISWDTETKTISFAEVTGSGTKNWKYTLEYSLDGTSWTSDSVLVDKMTVNGSYRGAPSATLTGKLNTNAGLSMRVHGINTSKTSQTSDSDTWDIWDLMEILRPGFSDWVETDYISEYGGSVLQTMDDLLTAFGVYYGLEQVVLEESASSSEYILQVSHEGSGSAYTYQWEYRDEDGSWKSLPVADDKTTVAINVADDSKDTALKVLLNDGRDVRVLVLRDGTLCGISNILNADPMKGYYEALYKEVERALGLASYSVEGKTLDFSFDGKQFNDYFYYGNIARDLPLGDKPEEYAERYKQYLTSIYAKDGLEAARKVWTRYLYDIYDPSYDKGCMTNLTTDTTIGYPYNTYGDTTLTWPKDASGTNSSPFHTSPKPEVAALNYDYLENGVDYSNYMSDLDKSVTAAAAGDSNRERLYNVDLSTRADAKIANPVAIIMQIQTSWQMFDMDHANATDSDGVATEVGAVANNTAMANLYDIKKALLRFADWIDENDPGNNLILGITDVEHAGTFSMFEGSTSDGTLYVTNNSDLIRQGLIEWDSFGNCEHVHYGTQALENTLNNLQANLKNLKDQDNVAIDYDSIEKVVVVVGGPTENKAGKNGYLCNLPWSTFKTNKIDSVYGIRVNEGTPYDAPVISWIDCSYNNTGAPYTVQNGSSCFTEKMVASSEDAMFNAMVKIAQKELKKKAKDAYAEGTFVEDILLEDVVTDEFELVTGQPVEITVGDQVKKIYLTPDKIRETDNKDGSRTIKSSDDENLTLVYRPDGTTYVSYLVDRLENLQDVKLHFQIQARETYIGSNNVFSNVGTPDLAYHHTKLDADGQPTDQVESYTRKCYQTPEVNVPVRFTVTDGGETTIMVGDKTDLKDLSGDIVADAEDRAQKYDQIKGQLIYTWELPDGSVVEAGSVRIVNGVVEGGSFPDRNSIFTGVEAGDYSAYLSVKFQPDPVSDRGNFSDSNTAVAVKPLTQTGRVGISVETDENAPENMTSLTLNKLWRREGGDQSKRPASIRVRLLRNGQVYPYGDQEWVTISPNAEGEWTYTFEDLPYKNRFGTLYEYSVEEEGVASYRSKVGMAQAVPSRSVWVPATDDEVLASKGTVPYAIVSDNGIALGESSPHKTQVVKGTENVTCHGVTYTDYLTNSNLVGWSFYGSGIKSPGGRYIKKDGSLVTATSGDTGLKSISDGKIKLNNKYLVLKTDGTLGGDSNVNKATSFKFYKQISIGNESYRVTMYNSLIDEKQPYNDSGAKKQIDYLKEENADTSLTGTKYYRQYLDFDGGNPEYGVDFLFVIDRTSSMNTVLTDSTLKRMEGVNKILNGAASQANSQGLLSQLLDLSPRNKVAVILNGGSNSNGKTYALQQTVETPVLLGWTDKADVSGPVSAIAGVNGNATETNYGAGLLRAIDMLDEVKGDGNAKVVIFLSDGTPTAAMKDGNKYVSDESDTDFSGFTYAYAIRDAAVSASKDNFGLFQDLKSHVDLYTIGLGSENFEVLEYMAERGNGAFAKVTTEDDLKAAFDAVADYYYPSNVTITDRISRYVELCGAEDGEPLDFLVKRITDQADGSKEEAVLWKGSWDQTSGEIRPASGSTNSDIVSEVAYIASADQNNNGSIQVSLDPDYRIKPGERIEISYNLKISKTANNELANSRGTYPSVGDEGTDHDLLNPTSSGQAGFRSNEAAYVSFDKEGISSREPYKHPVIQTPLTIDLKVNKVWADDNPNDIASVSVRLLRNGQPCLDESGKEILAEIKGEDSWEYTFRELPGMDAEGRTYTYSVEEEAVGGYLAEYSFNRKDNIVTITNKPDYAQITVKKTVMGASTQQAFPFALRVDTGRIPVTEEDVSYQYDQNDPGRVIFTLKAGESVRIKVQKGSLISLTECDHAGYSTVIKYMKNGSWAGETAGDQVEFLADADEIQAEVINTSGPALPAAGGPGSHIYTLVGLLILAVAFVYSIRLRCKVERRKQE